MEDDLLTKLKSVLDDPQKTLEDIILDSSFQYAFQKEYEPLLNFLKKDETIIELGKYCFDPKMIKKTNFSRLSQLSIQVFSSTLPSIFQIFIKSHVLAQMMHDFLLNDAVSCPLHCGFLYRIISQQVRWGEPIIFSDFLDVGILLLKSIHNLAIQDLIVVISTKNSVTIFQEMNMILLLSEIMISQMDENAASTLIQIYDNISDDSPLMQQYRNSQVVQNIIDFCIASKWIVLSTDLLSIAIQIVESNTDLLPIILKKKKIFEIRKNNITTFSVLTIPLFMPNYLQLFSLYFEPNSCKCLHQLLANDILHLKPEEIVTIARIPNFIDSVVNSYHTKKWCYHMTQIIVIFGRILPMFPNSINNKNWVKFLNSYGNDIIQKLEQPYGGDVPKNNLIIDDTMDEFFIHEEEESEFEEENEQEEEEKK